VRAFVGRGILPHRRRYRAVEASTCPDRSQRAGCGSRSRRQYSSVEITYSSRGDCPASGRHSLSGDSGPEGGWFRGPGRGVDQGNGQAGRSDRPDSPRTVDRGHRGVVLRRIGADHATAWRDGRRSQNLRVPLVLALDSALPTPAHPCAGRVAVCAIVRAGDADLFPTRRRQSIGAQGNFDACRAGRRHGYARLV